MHFAQRSPKTFSYGTHDKGNFAAPARFPAPAYVICLHPLELSGRRLNSPPLFLYKR